VARHHLKRTKNRKRISVRKVTKCKGFGLRPFFFGRPIGEKAATFYKIWLITEVHFKFPQSPKVTLTEARLYLFVALPGN